MRKAGRFVAGAALLWGMSTGCTNLQDVIQAKGEGAGTSVVYPVAERQAWQITNAILAIKRPAPAPREWRGEGYVLQSVQATPLSSGAFIGIWVEAAGPDRAKVTFLRKRKGTADTVRALTDREFHHDFATLVELQTGLCAAGSSPSAGEGAVSPAPSGSGAAPATSSSPSSPSSPSLAQPTPTDPSSPVSSSSSSPVAPLAVSAPAGSAGSGSAGSGSAGSGAGGAVREVPLPPWRGAARSAPAPGADGVPAPAGSVGAAPGASVREVPLPPPPPQRVR